jgi:general secretion pathway protein D
MKFTKIFSSFGLLLLILISVSHAQTMDTTTTGAVIAPSTDLSNESLDSAIQSARANKKVSMQFDHASLDQVLKFISKISGVTVVKDTDVKGDITIISEKDITVDDAFDVLNSALATKGYTSIREGNVLKIVALDNAREDEVPVHVGVDPNSIKPGDEVITQVMPLSYADAVALKKDLATLIPKDEDLSSNARSNTLIVTGAASNVHRIAQIVKELDSPQASVTQIRVFTLKNADVETLAKTLNDIFKQDVTTPTQTGGGGGPGNFFRQFAGGGGPGGGGANPATATGNSAIDDALARARASVKITTDDRTNSLVVSAPAADMLVIEDLVHSLDKDQTEQEGTLVIHLKHGIASSLSPMLITLLQANTNTSTPQFGGGGFAAALARATQQTATAKGASLLQQVQIGADSTTNSLIFITSPRNFPRLREMVDALDYARDQVMVEVIIAERTITDQTQLGAEWSLTTVGNIFGNMISTVSSTGFNLGSNITQGLTYSIAHQGIQATFQALKSNTNLKVLSTPRILASDNSLANIYVGEQIPFLSNTQVTDVGSVVNSYTYQSVGLILTVTPRVNPDDYVSMQVNPSVSQIDPTTQYFNAPVIDTRLASTNVMVHDGETVTIGGLMQDTYSNSENKVPLLGDIPGLGLLFKYKNTQKEKTELIILLTPHIMHNNTEELRNYSAPDKAILNNYDTSTTKKTSKK